MPEAQAVKLIFFAYEFWSLNLKFAENLHNSNSLTEFN